MSFCYFRLRLLPGGEPFLHLPVGDMKMKDTPDHVDGYFVTVLNYRQGASFGSLR